MLKVDGNKLILAIANKGYSAVELSKESGVNQVTIARMKAGIQEPRPQTLGKIARALGCKVEDLLED